MNNGTSLEVSKITSGYGKLKVLQDVSVQLGPREVVTILGPNGAGKTTLLRTVMGLVKPSQGSISFQDEDITNMEPEDCVGLGISYVPQENQVFSSLTVAENLFIGSYLTRDTYDRRVEEVLDIFPKLAERMDQRAGTMSGGEQQMVAMARGLMVGPSLLLLDEPSSGLAPNLIDSVLKKIRIIKDEKDIPILLVIQSVDLLELAERGYLLSAGKIELEDDVENLKDNKQVQNLYFGG